jgi:Cytosol aminopeptidase family, N-terminal domain
MEVTGRAGRLDKESVDAIILMLNEGDSVPRGTAAMIDKSLDGAVTALLREGEFTGKSRQQSVLHTQDGSNPKKWCSQAWESRRS